MPGDRTTGRRAASEALAYVWQDIAGMLVLGVALFAISVRRFARLVR